MNNTVNRTPIDIGVKKKHLFLKSLLVVIGLLMTSVSQVWGYSFNYPHLYFYNSGDAWTNEANKVMFFYYYHRDDGDKKQASQGFNMTKVEGTKLWYVCASENRGTNLSGFIYGFGATSGWPWEEGDNWSTRWTNLCGRYDHTGTSQTSLPYGTYLCTSSGSSNLSVSTLDEDSEEHTPLNHAQYIKKYTGTGTSYSASEVNSGTVTISAYKMTASGTASNTSNSATISDAATTSANVDAAYTGEVTISAEANTGYVFLGWYSSANGGSSDRLDYNASDTYDAPNSTKTLYARFAPKFPTRQTLYLVTNAKWREGSPYYAAVFFNDQNETWVTCSVVAGTSSEVYSVDVPDGNWGGVVFCKMNPVGGNTWSNVWCQTSDMHSNGLNNAVYITGDCSYSQRWGKYAPVPAIVGTMNDWNPIADQFTDGVCVISDLSASSGYQFKLAVGRDDSWYGYGGADNTLTYVGQTSEITLSTGTNNMALATAGTGNYTFTWDGSDLKVDFPSVGHPSTDYVYVKPYSDWSPVNAHLMGGTYGTVYTYDPALSTVTIYGNSYYYTALGDHNKIAFGQGVSNGHRTKDLENSDAPTSHMGEFYDASGEYAGWAWADFTATLSLDHQAATNTPAPNNITVSFNKTTNLTGDVLTTDPEKNGYSFGGYYTEQGGSGSQFINASGNVQNVSGYTSSGKWIRTGSEATTTVYAKWTQNITLDQNGADKNGTTSLAAIYNGVLNTSGITATPKKIGKKFAGWTTVQNSGSVVIEADGTVNTVASWTDGDKKWIHEGASTLYASWEDDPNEFIGVDGDWTKGTNWSSETAPTDDWSAVTISKPVTITNASVHIGSLTIGASGSLTIAKDGALEVAGTITNTVASRIVINSDGSNQGALIFNSTGSTAATVNMTMNAASDKFQFIAIPVSYVDVSAAFAGPGVYTYVWKNSAHDWEKRGYYDGISAFEAVIAKGIGFTSFSGNLVNTSDFSSGSLSYSSSGYGDVYMFGNSWTAPIKKSAMTLSGIESVNILLANNNWDGVISDDIIPALQAYAVIVGSSGGSVTINYTDAVRGVASGSRTSPLKAPQRFADEEPEPITVYVSGNEMRTRIRLFEDEARFSEELDEGWEAYYMEGEGYAGDLYAMGPERKMNVLATSNLEGTVVGFVPGQAENYTISFAGDGKGYYLNDMKEEESTLIKEGNTYEFTSDPSTNATRFVISKTPIAKTPTSIENTNDGVKARKQLIDGALYIIRDGRIYTVTGALVK